MHDEEGYGEKRGVFQRGDSPQRIGKPRMDEIEAKIEEKASEHEFREDQRLEGGHDTFLTVRAVGSLEGKSARPEFETAIPRPVSRHLSRAS